MPLSLICLALMTAPRKADPVNFIRTYALTDRANYTLQATLPSASVTITLKFEGRTNKLLANGGANISWTTKEFPLPANAKGEPPDSVTSDANSNGLPATLTYRENNYLYALFALASATPAKAVSVGESFPIAWQSSDNKISFQGKGSVESVSLARHTITSLRGADFNLAGTVLSCQFTSTFDASNGALLKSEGTFGMDRIQWQMKILQTDSKELKSGDQLRR
jgi:hypothetical protein